MHSTSFDTDASKDHGSVLVAIATLIIEGRIASRLNPINKGCFESPHYPFSAAGRDHKCDFTNSLCSNYYNTRKKVLEIWKKNIPLCIDILLKCSCESDDTIYPFDDGLLVEKWWFSINQRRNAEPLPFTFSQLISAIRSQLYFSQLTVWSTVQEQKVEGNLSYRFVVPGEMYESTDFASVCLKHDFPLTDIGNGSTVAVSCFSLPRMAEIPHLKCHQCRVKKPNLGLSENRRNTDMLFDDRMHTVCTLKGKHRCEEYEDVENYNKVNGNTFYCAKKFRNVSVEPSTSHSKFKVNLKNHVFCEQKNSIYNDLKVEDKGKLLLDAIERGGLKSTNTESLKDDSMKIFREMNESSDNDSCDKCESDISSIKNKNIPKNCDNPTPNLRNDFDAIIRTTARKKLTFGDKTVSEIDTLYNSEVPSAKEQAKFKKDLDNAASMVFHSRTGLPLTSSPAPVRRGKTCFDFDSTINSVSAIKSALFPTTITTDEDSESDGSIASPSSPETNALAKSDLLPIKYRRKGHAASLLGSFEESVLNGRLEPVSTVHGFTAELGASGSFVPKHTVVPVTVFFYTLGDNDKVSSPYLSHINLGKKGYNVPRSGTVQVTLFNPLGTVVKMFVIMYDLNDMPNNSQTFIRQRTLYMPTNCNDKNVEWGPKWLRYLIHLRFISSKSGKIYLHSDIRMIIFRKSDMDTATAHGMDMSYELRSFTHMPVNPRFSPRK